jgi:hypothetical protein
MLLPVPALQPAAAAPLLLLLLARARVLPVRAPLGPFLCWPGNSSRSGFAMRSMTSVKQRGSTRMRWSYAGTS